MSSSQMSETIFHDLSDNTGSRQSSCNDLLNLGLRFKGCRMVHLNIQS